MSLKGKVVIVTGGARGIGREIATAFARQGACVVVGDKNATGAEQTAFDIREENGDAIALAVDLAEPREIQEFIDRSADKFGSIDVLVNNAAVMIDKPPEDLAVEEWDHVLSVNLRAPFLCAREAAGHLRKRGGGSIINIASTRAVMSEAHTESYSASKGGLLALTHSLAVSLAPDRIRVNAISPGWIQNEDYDSLETADHEQHPAGRVGRPQDIARTCLFLADPANDFITGANFIIDGGMIRKMIYEE